MSKILRYLQSKHVATAIGVFMIAWELLCTFWGAEDAAQRTGLDTMLGPHARFWYLAIASMWLYFAQWHQHRTEMGRMEASHNEADSFRSRCDQVIKHIESIDVGAETDRYRWRQAERQLEEQQAVFVRFLRHSQEKGVFRSDWNVAPLSSEAEDTVVWRNLAEKIQHDLPGRTISVEAAAWSDPSAIGTRKRHAIDVVAAVRNHGLRKL